MTTAARGAERVAPCPATAPLAAVGQGRPGRQPRHVRVMTAAARGAVRASPRLVLALLVAVFSVGLFGSTAYAADPQGGWAGGGAAPSLPGSQVETTGGSQAQERIITVLFAPGEGVNGTWSGTIAFSYGYAQWSGVNPVWTCWTADNHGASAEVTDFQVIAWPAPGDGPVSFSSASPCGPFGPSRVRFGQAGNTGNGTRTYWFGGPQVTLPDPPPVGTGNNCTLTDVSLVRLARGVGLPEAQIQTAVAVALAESGGLVNALNFIGPNPGSWDIGVWQINDDANPSYVRNTLFTSPGYNAFAMKEIYTAAASWSPFPAFTSGAHNRFMTRAAAAVQAAPTGTLGGNSCSDLSGSDVVGNLADDNPDDSGSDCGFTINPFTALKCAFIPQDVPERFAEFKDVAGEKPPVSLIADAQTFLSAVTDDSATLTPEESGIAIGADTIVGTAWDPLAAVGADCTRPAGGTCPTSSAFGGAAGVLRTVLQVGMWAGLFFLIWRRANAALGGSTESDEP